MNQQKPPITGLCDKPYFHDSKQSQNLILCRDKFCKNIQCQYCHKKWQHREW